ncbi:MAG: DNA-directed RNA polymerase subunit omega [Ruminococcaceae bacterium]|nr:DNA-directed RNA polymerase subunit omega [Oscillospiraceae bacterium]
MMLYPTIQELTEGKINRYELVIAAAKGARKVIEKDIEIREAEQKKKELERAGSKEKKPVVVGENLPEKAVTIAIKKIYAKKFTVSLENEGEADAD